MEYQKTGDMAIGQVSFHNDKKVGKSPTIMNGTVVAHENDR